MLRIVKTEFLKLKNFSILWIGISAMLAGVLLTRFMAIASDGTEYTFSFFSSEVIWNVFTLILPSTIALLAGYIVERERTDDTLKNIRVIPISFRRMLAGKLIVIAILCICLSVIEFIFTLGVVFLSGYAGITGESIFRVLYQMIVINMSVYISVLPIIVLTCQKEGAFINGVVFAFFYGFVGTFAASHDLANIYPITAGLSLANYNGDQQIVYNKPTSLLIIIIILFISAVLLIFAKDRGKKQKKEHQHKV